MTSREWSKGFRLLLGFLVAPAVVPIVCLFMLSGIGGAGHVDCGAGLALIIGDIIHPGILLSYVCAGAFGLPYVCFIRKTERLDFWGFAIPILWLALVFSALLSEMSATVVPFVAGVVVFVPSIFLSVLCFYFISVRRSR